jgi:hypothetical protein
LSTVLLFVVARDRPDRYKDLRQMFASRGDVGVILDRREGDRRERGHASSTVERRGRERRRRFQVEREVKMLGWSMIDTDEIPS